MRNGGFGGANLYVAFKGKDSEWMNPINLAKKINSDGHEITKNIVEIVIEGENSGLQSVK